MKYAENRNWYEQECVDVDKEEKLVEEDGDLSRRKLVGQ